MTLANYDAMSLDELRQYVLTYREDVNAFHAYVDRSKAAGRMIIIDQSDPEWEENLEQRLRQATSDEPESN